MKQELDFLQEDIFRKTQVVDGLLRTGHVFHEGTVKSFVARVAAMQKHMASLEKSSSAQGVAQPVAATHRRLRGRPDSARDVQFTKMQGQLAQLKADMATLQDRTAAIEEEMDAAGKGRGQSKVQTTIHTTGSSRQHQTNLTTTQTHSQTSLHASVEILVYPWTIKTWLIFIFLGGVIVCGQILCCAGCLFWPVTGLINDPMVCHCDAPREKVTILVIRTEEETEELLERQAQRTKEDGAQVFTRQDVGRISKQVERLNSAIVGSILRREMRLSLFLPLIPLMMSPWTTCESGMPTLGYILYLPFLIRAKLVELMIIRKMGEGEYMASKFAAILGFTLGTMEHMDWFTDGGFPIQAYMCDPQATAHFAESFSQSSVWALAPLVASLRFWGIACFCLAVPALLQQFLGVLLGNSDEGLAMAADVPGFGALSDHYDIGSRRTNKNGSSPAKILVHVAKVFGENCVQLRLQSSFFGLTFAATAWAGKVKLLASMGLGLVSATYKTLQAIKDTVGLLRQVFNDGGDGWTFAFGGLVLGLMMQFCALVFVAWTFAMLYFSFQCKESHLFNISQFSLANPMSGCVDPN